MTGLMNFQHAMWNRLLDELRQFVLLEYRGKSVTDFDKMNAEKVEELIASLCPSSEFIPGHVFEPRWICKRSSTSISRASIGLRS
jgi:hypothetical protein